MQLQQRRIEGRTMQPPVRLPIRPRKHHLADLPPSTTYDAPVMNEALSDARNMMVWAISSGLPTRLSGTVAAKPAFLSAVPAKRLSIPVSIGPGATMLMRTPDEAASSAADLVSPSTACLLAEYMDAPAAPVWPYVDDTLTMLPLPWASKTLWVNEGGMVKTKLAPASLHRPSLLLAVTRNV